MFCSNCSNWGPSIKNTNTLFFHVLLYVGGLCYAVSIQLLDKNRKMTIAGRVISVLKVDGAAVCQCKRIDERWSLHYSLHYVVLLWTLPTYRIQKHRLSLSSASSILSKMETSPGLKVLWVGFQAWSISHFALMHPATPRARFQAQDLFIYSL